MKQGDRSPRLASTQTGLWEVCVKVHTCVYMYTCMLLYCVFVPMYVHICLWCVVMLSMCVCMFMCTRVLTWMPVYMCFCVFIWCVFHLHVYTCMCLNVSVYYMHCETILCMLLCVHVYGDFDWHIAISILTTLFSITFFSPYPYGIMTPRVLWSVSKRHSISHFLSLRLFIREQEDKDCLRQPEGGERAGTHHLGNC